MPGLYGNSSTAASSTLNNPRRRPRHPDRRRRASNLRLDVTGVLIFDGSIFLQLIEGESETVRALMNGIEKTIHPLYCAGATSASRDALPASGYCYAGVTRTVDNVKTRRNSRNRCLDGRDSGAFDLDD